MIRGNRDPKSLALKWRKRGDMMDKANLVEAHRLRAEGHIRDAERMCRDALELFPDSTEWLSLLGVLLAESGRADVAIIPLERAVSIEDKRAAYFSNLGFAQLKAGRLDEAVTSFEKAIGIDPDFADAHNNLGEALRKLERYGEAIPHFMRAINLGDLPVAYRNLALTLVSLEKFPQAITCLNEYLQRRPRDREALVTLGMVYEAEKRWDKAIEAYQASIALEPESHDAYLRLAAICGQLGLFRDGIDLYKKAIEMGASPALAHYHIGGILDEMGAFDEALTHHHRALSYEDKAIECHVNLSLIHLVNGNYEDGWREFEWRIRLPSHPRANFSGAVWKGEPLAVKRILLYAEQGLGDNIMFGRFIPVIVAMGAKVVLGLPPNLVRLFASFEGVERIISEGDEPPEFDYHISLISIAHVLGVRVETVPSSVPYLSCDHAIVEQWAGKLPVSGSRRIGIVWRGNTGYGRDKYRSVSYGQIKPVVDQALSLGMDVISLQKEQDGEVDPRIINLMGEVNDFVDTAALIANLDLVITVDTSVAHLAGALGKPVWLMNRFNTSWHWLRDRTDSPWYPTMHIFRQTQFNNWGNVIAEICAGLQAWSDLDQAG